MVPSPEPERPTERDQWARVLRDNWEELARSPFRDYFIASHRGCDDPRIWGAQARYDAAVVLHEFEPTALAGLHVLELGCGVGRLAGVIAPKVRSYTGIDIAPAMIAEATQRQASLTNARFVLGDGARIPDPARDRSYDLVFALAVFVHCPKALIQALVSDACSVLAPGGELRFQLRADEADPTGIQPASEAPLIEAPPSLPDSPPRADEIEGMRAVSALLEGRYYMGHAFRFHELRPFLAQAAPQAVSRVMRFDPQHIYVDLSLPH